MIPRFRRVARLLAVAAISATVLVFAEPAMAITEPETMADRRPVQAGPVEPGFPIDFVGVIWDSPADEHAEGSEQAGAHGAIRFRADGRWGPWIDLVDDGAEGDGQWASGLVAGDDADGYQVRGVPAGARSPSAVAINTTDGPTRTVGHTRGGAAGALASAQCRSRSDWGADESLRTWNPAFYPAQTLTVHHTATDNGADAESTMRAIYRYHAVDRKWGDIGYQYLIDESGVVYEGRWSGSTSRSCLTDGGDASDFGHETGDLDADGALDEMVTGAHAGGSNSGNMGVALLGTFTDVEPTVAAVDSLEDVLAELASRHDIDPTASVRYVNPVNGSKTRVDAISGHRDWSSTECPGGVLYGMLPTIRDDVKAAMSGGTGDDTPPPPTDAAPSNITVSPAELPVGDNQPLTVSGDGFIDGSTVTLENGKGHTPTITSTAFDGSALTLAVTVERKGPKSYWDVRVTNPGGSTGVCTGCLLITR